MSRVSSQRRRSSRHAHKGKKYSSLDSKNYRNAPPSLLDEQIEGTHNDWDDGESESRALRAGSEMTEPNEFEDAYEDTATGSLALDDPYYYDPYNEDETFGESDTYRSTDPYPNRDAHDNLYDAPSTYLESSRTGVDDDDYETRDYDDDPELLSGNEDHEWSTPGGRSAGGFGALHSPPTHPAHAYKGKMGEYYPVESDHAQSRGHGVYVEKPHTAFEDVAEDELPEDKGLPFHSQEPSPAEADPEQFPTFFHHEIGQYGEFNLVSRLMLELQQLNMFLITSLGMTFVVIMAFARYFNPFRKLYPKARVDFEYERRITGERYSERVQYYADFWGYQCEEYEIVTKGGWILKAHRISDPRRPGGRGYPVVLQHGILCTSLFFFTSEERSLGFWLVDQGYDVWSTNIRSNFRSGHTRFKRWDPRFWAWSLIELGDDLVDVVDFVLQETGYKQLAYVGHSQGTGSMFLALNKYKGFGQKISSFTALGPAVYPGSSLDRLPFRVMRMLPSRWTWSIVFGVRTFMPLLELARIILPKFLMGHLGYIVFGYLFDFHDHNWVDRHKPKIFCSTGVSTSSELLYYWIHCFVARGCVFDPRVRSPWFSAEFPPLTVAYGTIDHLVAGKPLVDRLLQYESNVQIVHILELQGYEHMDMVLGCDAYKVVFPKIKDTIVRTIDPEDVPMLGH